VRPAARWQAAIEILAEIAAQLRAADAILGDWGRAHRYAGAKDRAAISDLVFLVLRRRAELAHVAGTDAPRALVLAALARVEGAAPEALSTAIAEGGKYAMAPLSAAESALAARAAAMSDAELPTAARANVPGWLMPDLAVAFGGRLEAEAAALTGRAPLDLRVNTLKAARTQARERLAGEAVETELCPLSPVGLRVTGRRQVTGTAAFREGLVEVQDEGSQLAALLTGARPGETVVDLCAGAGGKTLAVAATMADRGRLVAFDSDPARLGRLAPRAARAGVTIVEARAADPLAAESDPLMQSLAGEADRVLLDAPCSG
jgi:16S rRNA (cytosine967-C5)-methyltransferase